MGNGESKEPYLINEREVFYSYNQLGHRDSKGKFEQITRNNGEHYEIDEKTRKLIKCYTNSRVMEELIDERTQQPVLVTLKSNKLIIIIKKDSQKGLPPNNDRNTYALSGQGHYHIEEQTNNPKMEEERTYNSKWRLEQTLKETQKVDLAQKQLYANDASGRLYAEIERYLKMSGSKLYPKYEAYFIQRIITKNESLQNIESFLLSISFYSEYSNQNRIADHSFADDPNSFYLWKSELIQLCDSRLIDAIGEKVLKHAIDCCINKRITPLPKEVSESIMSTKARQKAANEVFHDRFDDVISMQHRTHHVTALSKEMIEDALRRNVDITKFTYEPILKFDAKDLDHNHGKNQNQVYVDGDFK